MKTAPDSISLFLAIWAALNVYMAVRKERDRASHPFTLLTKKWGLRCMIVAYPFFFYHLYVQTQRPGSSGLGYIFLVYMLGNATLGWMLNWMDKTLPFPRNQS